MADDKQQIEKQLSNVILKDVFQKLHTMIVDNINTSSVTGKLFAANVISTNVMHELHFIKNPHKMCTRLLIILHKTNKPRTFIELREAITTEDSCEWLVELIDEKYNLKAPAVAQPEVAQACYNPSHTSIGDIAELTLVNDDLRRDDAEVMTENILLMKENARLKGDIERLLRATATLLTEDNKLKDNTERLPKAKTTIPTEESALKGENKRLPKANTTIPTEENRLKDDTKRLPKAKTTISTEENSLKAEGKRLPKANTTIPTEESALKSENKRLPKANTTIPTKESALKGENKRLPKANTTIPTEESALKSENKRLPKANTTIPTKESALKGENKRLPKANTAIPTKESALKGENKRLCLERKEYENKMVAVVNELKRVLPKLGQSGKEKFLRIRSVAAHLNSAVKVTQVDAANGGSESESEESTVPVDWFNASVPQRCQLLGVLHKKSRDADVIEQQSLASVCRLQNYRWHNPQLLFTLNQPPTDRDGDPREVTGLVTLDKYLYVVYSEYNTVEVFDCEDCCKKIKDIEVEEMKEPLEMIGSSVTSQLYISDWSSDIILRVDSKTGVSDVFVETGYKYTRLSLVENRLLVLSGDSLRMYDVMSGEIIKEIPLTEVITGHAIESNRDSFFVIHGKLDIRAVSEIDSEGRVIRKFSTKEQLVCNHLALDSVGRLLVTDRYNSRVVLFDEHLKYERILIDNKRLDNAQPWALSYDKNNNSLAVGLDNGHVKIFEY